MSLDDRYEIKINMKIIIILIVIYSTQLAFAAQKGPAYVIDASGVVKINNKMVELGRPLKIGDQIEIPGSAGTLSGKFDHFYFKITGGELSLVKSRAKKKVQHYAFTQKTGKVFYYIPKTNVKWGFQIKTDFGRVQIIQEKQMEDAEVVLDIFKTYCFIRVYAGKVRLKYGSRKKTVTAAPKNKELKFEKKFTNPKQDEIAQAVSSKDKMIFKQLKEYAKSITAN